MKKTLACVACVWLICLMGVACEMQGDEEMPVATETGSTTTAEVSSTPPPVETDLLEATDTGNGSETEIKIDTTIETETETETEIETEIDTSGVGCIPDADCLDLSRFNEAMLRETFPAAKDTAVSLCESGVRFTATCDTQDPQVIFDLSNMYRTAGYELQDTGSYVPFAPEEVSAIVLKVQASRSGIFELFCATGPVTEAIEGFSTSHSYASIGSDGWWYIYLSMPKTNEAYRDHFNNGARLDWSSEAQSGDTLVIGEIQFFKYRKEAKMYADEINKTASGETGYGSDTPAEGLERGYYVCLYQNKLGSEDAGVARIYATGEQEEAIKFCDRRKHLGYRICDERGNVVYTPYTLLQCDILREAKYVTTCTRTNGFKYGDAPINPAIDHEAKKVSCDRLVCWVLYRVGFIDQPVSHGVVVSSMHTWSEANGFIEITDKDALEPGDIILVRPNASGTYALHTFLYAGEAKGKGMFYRYDHGSDERINSEQPQIQELELDGAPFWRAYRPMATAQNNIYYSRYYQRTAE